MIHTHLYSQALGSNLESGGSKNETPKWQTSGRLVPLIVEPQSTTCLPLGGVTFGVPGRMFVSQKAPRVPILRGARCVV